MEPASGRRVDRQIKLMEVNPNPAWDFEAKLAFMAGVAGMSYAQMLELLVQTALARRPGA